VAAVAAQVLATPAGLPGAFKVLWPAGSAVLLTASPAGAGVGLVLLSVGLSLLAQPLALGWRAAALVLLLHLVLALSALAAQVAWRARVELAVLAGLLRDAAPAQAVAQLLGLVLALTSSAAAPHPWARVLAVAAAFGLALLVRRPAR
jgi:hypothetical protein